MKRKKPSLTEDFIKELIFLTDNIDDYDTVKANEE